MKRVNYIFSIAACLAALLTSCVKEEAYEPEQVSLQVSLDTRATTSQQQGDKIEDVMLWAFKCTLDANGLPSVGADATASGWRQLTNISNTYQELANIHVPLDVCAKESEPATQSYVLFAVINTTAFNPNFNLGRDTNYKTLTEAVFTNSGANSGAFWNTYPETSTPEVMPVSNWATFTVKTRDEKNEDGDITSSANTHNGKCYQLTLPVYRAVAKAQLSMRKTRENFDLRVLNAKIVSSAAPTNGAMFTKQDYVTSQHTSKETSATGATAFGYPNQTDGFDWWVTPSYGSSSPIQLCNFTNSDKIISYLPEDITVYDQGDNNVNGETAEGDEYQWVASTFLLENEKGNTIWNTTTPTDGGYCMEITYDITPEDTTDENKTEYVWLPAVVRNHDYQVNATVDANGDWKLTLNVNEWNEKTETHNYLNEVSIPQGGQIQWTSLPSGVQPNDGVLTLGAAANQQATCTFFLNTPANGTWQAELVTVEGQEGAITFADGKTTASGAIAGDATPAVLTIKTTKDNSLQGGGVSQNKVVLRITATATVGGVKRTYKVNGLTGITGVDYYTIVQDL